MKNIYKIVLTGNAGVGKTSLLNRIIYDRYNSDMGQTIGASFMAKSINIGEKKYTFHFWDTAGQERYKSIVPMYYRGSSGCLCVFDVTDKNSFTSLSDWINNYQIHNPSGNILIIANKCDLAESSWCQTKDEFTNFAKKNNMDVIFTSSVTGQNTSDMLTLIANKMLPAEDSKNNILIRSTNMENNANNVIIQSNKILSKKSSCNC